MFVISIPVLTFGVEFLDNCRAGVPMANLLYQLRLFMWGEIDKKAVKETHLFCRQFLGSTNDFQDHVTIVGFYHPSHTRPIFTTGIRICIQKRSQVNISIGYSYISQVKILHKVKFSKLEIYQSDC